MTPMGNLRTDNESDTVSLEGALKFTELNLQKLHGEALLIKKESPQDLVGFPLYRMGLGSLCSHSLVPRDALNLLAISPPRRLHVSGFRVVAHHTMG